MLLGLDTEPVLPPSAEEVQKIKMQAAARPMGGPLQPGFQGFPGFGPKPFMPLLGMLGSPGLGGFGLGGFPMPLPSIPRPPSPPGVVIGAAAKSAMPQPQHVPVPLTPGVQ